MTDHEKAHESKDPKPHEKAHEPRDLKAHESKDPKPHEKLHASKDVKAHESKGLKEHEFQDLKARCLYAIAHGFGIAKGDEYATELAGMGAASPKKEGPLSPQDLMDMITTIEGKNPPEPKSLSDDKHTSKHFRSDDKPMPEDKPMSEDRHTSKDPPSEDDDDDDEPSEDEDPSEDKHTFTLRGPTQVTVLGASEDKPSKHPPSDEKHTSKHPPEDKHTSKHPPEDKHTKKDR